MAVTVAGVYIKMMRGDGDGGHCRSERRLMEAMPTTTVAFEETRMNCWAIHLCDVFQADTWILQSVVFTVDFGYVSKSVTNGLPGM